MEKKGGFLNRILGPKKPRREREHPYADEPTGAAEARANPARITLLWFGLSTLLAVGGVWLQGQHGYIRADEVLNPRWDAATNVPLFAGLALLGFGFVRERWAKYFTMVGWVLFAAYWGLTARDLLVTEGQDYANFLFALVGVYFFVYLAYHEWLSHSRGVENVAVRFLNITAFIAAGTYFLIAKIVPFRVALIEVVGAQTRWMLDLFGQGEKKGLSFTIDRADTQGPVTFVYPDTYDTCPDGTAVGSFAGTTWEERAAQCTSGVEGWFANLPYYHPASENLAIVPVSIILACTAIQSIMLFVGLFFGTEASLKKKIYASLVVGGIIYVLNLVRNTGIIWLYGRGHASFWVMHNAIGKGGSLLAMVAIAFAVFRYFPEFFRSLVGVLDLVHRDGPIEGYLKLGRRRPEAALAAATVAVPAAGAVLATGAGGSASETDSEE
jgi:exosortase/archaeosortase family protein